MAKKVVIEEVRGTFAELFGRELALSNEVTGMVINRAGKQWKELWEDMETISEDSEVMKLFLAAENEAKKVAIVDPSISQLITAIDEDEHMQLVLEETLNAILQNKVYKVGLYAEFKRKFPRSTMDAWPYPGTDKDTPWLGNYKPDIVTKTDKVSGLQFKTQWTHDVADGLRRGKDLVEREADLRKEGEATNTSKYYKGWGLQARKAEASYLRAAKSVWRGMFKDVVIIHHQFTGVEGMPQVEIMWRPAMPDAARWIDMAKDYGKKETFKVSNAPKNVWIQPKGDSSNGDIFSVGQLVQFDVQAALKAGGTFGDLKATSAKTPKGAGTADEGDGSAMDADQAYSTFNRLANYIDKTANVAALRLIFANAKHEHHKDYLENVVTIGAWVDSVRKQYRKEIERVTEAKQKSADEVTVEVTTEMRQQLQPTGTDE